MSNNNKESAALAQLKKHFGNKVDPDVLLSVLSICDNNANQAITFLTAQDGDFVEDPNKVNQESIPTDYPAQKPTGRKPKAAIVEESDINSVLLEQISNMKKLFVNESSFIDHYNAQKNEYPIYNSCLLILLHQGVEVSKSSRARILASCWAHGGAHHNLSDYVLDNFKELFTLPEVLRAIDLVDAPRKVRALEKKLEIFTAQNAKQRKIGVLRSKIHECKLEYIEGTSLSGALSKRIKIWARKTFNKENLEFFALQMPKEPWVQLADLIHLNPKDLQCDWFLNVIYGADPPDNTILKLCSTLTPSNIINILKQGHNIPYSYIRTHIKPLPEEAKTLICNYTPIDTVIWYYEELVNNEVDKVIEKRLSNGEEPQFSYGKLMERLLTFKRSGAPFYNLLIPIAEERLKKIELLLEPPVVVFGDASYSMDVAIRTATIISSVLTVLSNAELKFFNNESVEPPCYPQTITEVIDVASNVRADGLTAPAAVILPYYLKKKPVKFFIMVTDEIENMKYNNQYYFPNLFLKYYEEVYPAKLVFVSFLANPSQKGRMVTSLENMGIEVLLFRLDGTRPDLTKLDTLLGILSSESSFFPNYVIDFAKIFQDKGFDALVDRIKNPPEKPKLNLNVEDKNVEDDDVKDGIPFFNNNNNDIVKKPLKPLNDLDIPQHFCCPITLEVMKEPVIAPSGYTYERNAIEEHLKKTPTDPFTNEPTQLGDLRPNRALKDAIKAFMEDHLIYQ